MQETAPLGIVTGLKFEAAILNRWRSALGPSAPLVRAVGGSAEAAEAAARDMVERGVQGLVSFGIAGALDVSLKAGTLLLPENVRDRDGNAQATDRRWADRLTGMLVSSLHVSTADLVSVEAPVINVAEKRALAETSQAQAVDMESLAVAKVAAARDVPFLTIRAVADEADRDLPVAARTAMNADGSVSGARVLVSLLRDPAQLAGLMRLGRQSRRAKRTLSRVAHRGLPWFGLTD